MFLTTLGNALLLFALRLTDVSLGTLRTVMIVRGLRKWAALLGFIEVTIWVIAISRVLGHLDTVWNVIGYSGGFATGTLLGMSLEARLALGFVYIHVISTDKGQEIAEEIRRAGYGATLSPAEGRAGPVYLVNVVARRKQIPHILRLINEVDAASFVTVEETRQVLRGYQRLAK